MEISPSLLLKAKKVKLIATLPNEINNSGKFLQGQFQMYFMAGKQSKTITAPNEFLIYKDHLV